MRQASPATPPHDQQHGLYPNLVITSMSLSSSSRSRIRRWLRDTPETALSSHRPLKRRRDTSRCDIEASSSRGSSPGKRRHRNHDDLSTSTQSTSTSGSIALSDRTILAASIGAKRSTSPSWHLTQLRTAQPGGTADGDDDTTASNSTLVQPTAHSATMNHAHDHE
jgi:hypothetical protein